MIWYCIGIFFGFVFGCCVVSVIAYMNHVKNIGRSIKGKDHEDVLDNIRKESE